MNGHLNEELLTQAGFLKESDIEYLVPIRIQEGDETVVLLHIIERLHKSIDTIVASC
jgi:hypothetical protein